MFTFGFNETKLKELTTRIPLESRISQIFMRTWGATTTVLPPAGPEGKHGRFKGKYVNRKTARLMIKLTEFPAKNGRVDRKVLTAALAYMNTILFHVKCMQVIFHKCKCIGVVPVNQIQFSEGKRGQLKTIYEVFNEDYEKWFII